ncbi:hypothetical protein BVRB_2g027350 [Beta vulgaris subsp. vulgaris]|nr:hypothetical protein BVRB_2g027350 [Beta vulgaris subsp. vulgaris]
MKIYMRSLIFLAMNFGYLWIANAGSKKWTRLVIQPTTIYLLDENNINDSVCVMLYIFA